MSRWMTRTRPSCKIRSEMDWAMKNTGRRMGLKAEGDSI